MISSSSMAIQPDARDAPICGALCQLVPLEHFAHGGNQLAFLDRELGLGLLLQIFLAVLGTCERCTKDQILDLERELNFVNGTRVVFEATDDSSIDTDTIVVSSHPDQSANFRKLMFAQAR